MSRIKPRLDPYDASGGFCTMCNKPCDGEYVDVGCDGPDWQIVSDCCHEQITDYPPEAEDGDPNDISGEQAAK